LFILYYIIIYYNILYSLKGRPFLSKHLDPITICGAKFNRILPYGNFNDSISYLKRRIYENPKILFYMLK